MALACGCSKPLDCKKLLEDCDDETSFANRCLQIFVRETQVDMDSIAAALGKNDYPQVARLAHRIKGASASIRARFLQEEAARLQVFGGEEQGAEANLCFSRLRAEFDNFKRFITTLPPLPD
jgi:HPt (histidine-containing phosphotransfer) domain-containing protein